MHSYYYPINHPSYPLPTHIHSELTAIHHDRLLHDQALLQRYAKANRQLLHTSAATIYEAQIAEKQLRISSLMRRSHAEARLEHDKLRESAIQESLKYKQLLRQMELQRMIIIDKQRGKYFTERKWNPGRVGIGLQFGNHIKQYQSALNFSARQDHITNISAKRGQEQSNEKDKKSYYTQKKQDLVNCYETFGVTKQNQLKENQQKLKSIEKTNSKDTKPHIQQINKSKAADLSPLKAEQGSVTNKKKNRVTFDLPHTKPNQLPNRSYHESPQILKPAKVSHRKTHSNHQNIKSDIKPKHQQPAIKKNASKLISSRLKISSEVYRDSDLRNLKYESNHLFNTFESELRQRSQLRERLCKQHNVIQRFGLLLCGV